MNFVATVEQWIPLLMEIKPMMDTHGAHLLIMPWIMTLYGTLVIRLDSVHSFLRRVILLCCIHTLLSSTYLCDLFLRMVRMVIQITSLGHKVFPR